MSADEIRLTPREASVGTRVSSWWVDGSRERYGEAYFLSEQSTIMLDGGVKTETVVWQNRRPWTVNERVAVLERRPRTWRELDAVVWGEAP